MTVSEVSQSIPTKVDSNHFNTSVKRWVFLFGGFFGGIVAVMLRAILFPSVPILGLLAIAPVFYGIHQFLPRKGMMGYDRSAIKRASRSQKRKSGGDYFLRDTSLIKKVDVDDAIAKLGRKTLDRVNLVGYAVSQGWLGVLSTPETGHDTLITETTGGNFALLPRNEQYRENIRLAGVIIDTVEGHEPGTRLTLLHRTGPDTMVKALANLEMAFPEGVDIRGDDPAVVNVRDAYSLTFAGASEDFTGISVSVLRPPKYANKIRLDPDVLSTLPIFRMTQRLASGLSGKSFGNLTVLSALDLAMYVHKGWDFDPRSLTRFVMDAHHERDLLDIDASKTLENFLPSKVDVGFDFMRAGSTFTRSLRIKRSKRGHVEPAHFMPLYSLKGLDYVVAIPIDVVPADKAQKANSAEATFRRGKSLSTPNGRRRKPGDYEDVAEVEARERNIHHEQGPQMEFFPLVRYSALSFEHLNATQSILEDQLNRIGLSAEVVEGESLQWKAFLASIGLPVL